MRTCHALAAVAVLAATSPAAAQLQNRSISVESTISTPLADAAGAHAGIALAASAWLEGPAEGVLRLRLGTAPRTGGRTSATSVSGTAGIRVSLLPDPLRPQLGIELGWARLGGSSDAEDRIAFGVAAGLEWFPARDLSITARAALCGVGSTLLAEVALAAAAYF